MIAVHSILENSSVIRQKDESQDRDKKKKSTPSFPINEHFLPPDSHIYVCVTEGKKYSFFGKFGVLCFLFAILRFALLPFYQQIAQIWLPQYIKVLSSCRDLHWIHLYVINFQNN